MIRANPIDISEVFHEQVSEIINTKASNQYWLESSIMLPDGTTIELSSEYINSLSIHQRFIVNYRDLVEMSVSIPVNIYQDLVKYNQDLVMKIEVYAYEKETIEPEKHLVTLTYQAIIKRNENPDLSVPQKRIDNTTHLEGREAMLVNIDIELIPELVYHLRKFKINYILNHATMEQSILFICHLLDIKKTYIVPPDNDAEYDNVVIPPLCEISDIFNYLQDTPGYGVYNYGINYYFYNECLYVLPAFQTPESIYELNVYNVGKDAYAQSPNYHIHDGDVLNVVCNSSVKMIKNSQSSVEDLGNAYIVDTPHKHIREAGELIADDLYDVSPELLTNVQRYNDFSGVKPNSFTQTFVRTDNLTKVYTSLLTGEITTLAFSWAHAKPFVINPSTKLSWLYDKDEKINAYKGWVAEINYTFAKINDITKKKFGCVATIVAGFNEFEQK